MNTLRRPAFFMVPILLVALAGFGVGAYMYQSRHHADKSDTALAATPVPTPTSRVFRVGLQAGHWKNDELPSELSKLYWSTGTSAGGYNEWEVNLEIAQDAAALLESQGVMVDVLPATVPIGYKADAFVAIHADGNDDTSVSGYKVAGSLWDDNGQAAALSRSLSTQYGLDTSVKEDSETAISDNMTQYYAFNFIRYQYSIDATTPGALIEVGYLTNSTDRKFLTKSAQTAAQGVADGVMAYLKTLE